MPNRDQKWRKSQRCANAKGAMRLTYAKRDLAQYDAKEDEKPVRCSACKGKFHIVKKK